MTVNNYKFSLGTTDKYLNIPIQIKTDNLGRDDLMDIFEEEVIEQVINPIEDFEVTRFSHKDWVIDNQIRSSIEYKFYFFNRSVEVDTTNSLNSNLWISDYVFTDNPNFTGNCFTEAEVYYGANSFKRSFFKLDFYDTSDSETQQLYLSIIIPTQQGKVRLSNTEPYNVSVGDIDGPTLPNITPETNQSINVEESQKVYDDAVKKVIIENEKKRKDNEKKTNIGNIGYKAQLEYELSEQKRIAEESKKQNIYDTTLGMISIDDNTATEGDVNQNPAGLGEPTTATTLTAPPNVDIKLPDFVLDYIGDKEGYFIYWLKDPNYINIDSFFMSAKFFNAKTGQFIRMMNTPNQIYHKNLHSIKINIFIIKLWWTMIIMSMRLETLKPI